MNAPELGQSLSRVLMVSTSYPENSNDWKGLFIREIIESLVRNSMLEISVWQPGGPLPDRVRSELTNSDEKWFRNLMANGGIAHALRQGPMSGLFKAVELLARLRRMYQRTSDIQLRHVHWLQNALPIPKDDLPLVISVLGSDLSLLDFPGVVSRLRRVFRHRRVVLCPNASWMSARLIEKFAGYAEVVALPFGIGQSWFEIERKPSSPDIWLCVSRLTPQKIGPLFSWGEAVFLDGKRQLHLIGPNQAGMDVPKWVHYHGSLSPEDIRADWFSRAKGLISLSRHSEGRPQVMLEAMASGIPVLASKVPAHDDFVEHRVSGWLCGDLDAFIRGFEYLNEGSINLAIGSNARESVKTSSGTWDSYANRLLEVYWRALS